MRTVKTLSQVCKGNFILITAPFRQPSLNSTQIAQVDRRHHPETDLLVFKFPTHKIATLQPESIPYSLGDRDLPLCRQCCQIHRLPPYRLTIVGLLTLLRHKS